MFDILFHRVAAMRSRISLYVHFKVATEIVVQYTSINARPEFFVWRLEGSSDQERLSEIYYGANMGNPYSSMFLYQTKASLNSSALTPQVLR